jgi:molybdopterin converting factor small subunit
MVRLELKYLAHISMVTGLLEEAYESNAVTFRELLDELEERFSGFREIFLDPDSSQIKISAMIQVKPEGKNPFPVIDLDQPIPDGSIVTFW